MLELANFRIILKTPFIHPDPVPLMPRTRNSWLLLIVGFLVVANVLYYLISGWGLITIHADNVPLKDIVRSIERQGHITLTTNVDLEKPIHMYVTKVPVIEALETLAAITDSRWSLCYVVAPNTAQLTDGLTQIKEPKLPETWKRVAVPMPPFLNGLVGGAADPRILRWRVEAPSTTNLQDYLAQGALSADLTFVIPADWNPAIAQPPPSGQAESVVKNLVSNLNGKYKEFFFLGENNRREFRGERPPDQRTGGPAQMPTFDFVRIDERIQQQIAQLPPDEQKEAKDNYDKTKALFQSMATLSPEERRAKMREFFQNPDNQDRMESRDSRRTPEQRAARGARYVQNRAAVRGH